MKNHLATIIFILFISLLSSCKNRNNNLSQGVTLNADTSITIKYAKGFTISQLNENCKLVEITDPTGKSNIKYRYALTPKGVDNIEIPAGYTQINTPLERVICMTTLQLSGFIKLGQTDKIVGITSTRFLQNEDLNRRIEDKKLKRIGIEGEFDVEVVLSQSPDVIFVSPFKRGGYAAIEDLGIPMISYLGYKEASPLGQAEWIKFIGLLIGKEQEAQESFGEIEKRYNELAKLTETIEKRPTVMSGELHSGNWYVVGGESYLAQIFRDAGADYFMKNDDESGGFYVDFESVYSEGHDADFWRIVNSYNGTFDYSALEAMDSRYSDFKPFRDKNVIYCNLRDTPFYENTPMEPEVILADLIKIFHPHLLTNYVPRYYTKL